VTNTLTYYITYINYKCKKFYGYRPQLGGKTFVKERNEKEKVSGRILVNNGTKDISTKHGKEDREKNRS